MAKVVIALGSNLNNPYHQLKEATRFLVSISNAKIRKSSIYRSEPVGPSENDFLNAVVEIYTQQTPSELFKQLKSQEKKQGRPSRYPKWTARTIDLDIITWDDLVVETDTLIIPHKEYIRRLFVLLPLKELFPDWEDPGSAQHVNQLIEQAPQIEIEKTTLNW